MQLGLESNFVSVIRQIQDVGKTQLPFATALALTKTAKDVQQRAIVEMSHRFKIRRAFMKSVWRISPATKDKPVAGVGLTERGKAMLAKFEKGDDKKPTAGSAIAVPTSNIPDSGDRRVPKNLWPETGQQKDQQSKVARYQRLGLFRIGSAIFMRQGRSIVEMFALTKDAKIKPRLGVHEWGHQEVEKRWPTNFRDALLTALRTRR